MAPVTATTTGVARQIIDNPELTQLLERLSAFDTSNPDVEDVFDDSTLDCNASRLDLEGLVGELERWPRWKFQEMVSENLLFKSQSQSGTNEWKELVSALTLILNCSYGDAIACISNIQIT